MAAKALKFLYPDVVNAMPMLLLLRGTYLDASRPDLDIYLMVIPMALIEQDAMESPSD